MSTLVTAKNARAALSAYYQETVGIRLTRGNGVVIDSVEDGVITYHTNGGDTRKIRAAVEIRYIFGDPNESVAN